MKFICLLLSSSLAAFGLGFCKFFGLSHLADAYYSPESKDWIIQLVGAIMTLGPVAAYWFSSPLAASLQKRSIMVVSSLATALTLLIGHLGAWFGSPWLYCAIVGFNMGVFSVAKMSAIPLESRSSGRSTTQINAAMSVVFIVGLLMGLFFGTWSYQHHGTDGVWLGILAFTLAAVPAAKCGYQQEQHVPLKQAKAALLENSVRLTFHFPHHLLSSPLLWGSAGALSLAVTAYAEQKGLGSDVACSLMSLYAAFGTIIGNAWSTRVKSNQHRISWLCSMAFLLSCLMIPLSVETLAAALSTSTVYALVSLWMVIAGVFFGSCTNLVDAEFLEHCAERGKEGPGAALQSLMIAWFSFVLGGLIGVSIYLDWFSSSTQFLALFALSLPAVALLFCLAFSQRQLDKILRPGLAAMVKALLKCRYKINVKGMDQLPQNGGCLILPNHPAEIDPVILTSYLQAHLNPRPVVTEAFFHMPLLRPLMNLVGAFAMPDLETGAGANKKKRIAATLKELGDRMDEGESILIYPAGRLMRSGSEQLRAASGVHQILRRTKKQPALLVIRTRGLWGSSFSTVQNQGKTPDLSAVMKRALKTLICNGILFCPRRKVSIDIQRMDELKAIENHLEFNQRLQSHYNEGGEEPLSLIPERFWSTQSPNIVAEQTNADKAHETLDDSSWNRVIPKFASRFQLKAEHLERRTRLAEDLAMDSINKAELLSWLGEEFDVSDVELNELQTCTDIVLAASGGLNNNDQPEASTSSKTVESQRPQPQTPQAKTIPLAFLECCDRMSNLEATADTKTGTIPWSRFKLAVLLMAREFKTYPETHIGIMLPASNAAALCSMAVLMASKVPVMLNWTVGHRNLDHAVQTTGLEHILSSSAFLDQLDQVDLEPLEPRFVTLESLKAERFKWGEKIIAALDARKSASQLCEAWQLNQTNPDQEAVILFTSGSESAPKGVPLSHTNLLTNIKDALSVMDFHGQDCLLGFLPPFHSFGFTITTMMPLVSGLKVVYHPNPNESRKLAIACEKHRITRLCGTPTFINNIVSSAKNEQLQTVKTYVAGAEKMPTTLVEKIESLGTGAEVLEGYGITECSPVLTMNRPGSKRMGVGQPFPSVSILIVDPKDLSPSPHGERGLILAKGPSVFCGYFGSNKDPFVTIGGEPWYKTGDLGYLSDDGSVVLAGRMKRFVKVAGEMISLPALEQTLCEQWPHNDDGPVLAVEAIEVEGERPKIGLFCKLEISLKQANDCLRDAGFSPVAKCSERLVLDEIPLLGTGKTNYPALKAMLCK